MRLLIGKRYWVCSSLQGELIKVDTDGDKHAWFKLDENNVIKSNNLPGYEGLVGFPQDKSLQLVK